MRKRFQKWFSITSTIIFLACAMLPGALGISTLWRPWLFIVSIMWFYLAATGFFIS